jgi:hypothetical protein
MKILLVNPYPSCGSYTEIFRNLASQDRFRVHSVTEDVDAADIILFVDARSDHDDWTLRAIRNHPLVRAFPEKAFIYNEMDRPWCALPGLYVSMPAWAFNPARQRAWCYVAEINPYVAEVAGSGSSPELLFSFVGRRCHRVRDQIFRLEHPRTYISDTTLYNFFGAERDSLDAQKRAYAEVIRRSKFVLCPRGSGPASFRLFETMAAGRVPVVLSDSWVPPIGPRWDAFTIVVPESEVAGVPWIIESHEDRSERMAAAAREAWEEWFAPDVLFHRMVEACVSIRDQRRVPEAVRRRVPDARFVELAGRDVARRVRDVYHGARAWTATHKEP